MLFLFDLGFQHSKLLGRVGLSNEGPEKVNLLDLPSALKNQHLSSFEKWSRPGLLDDDEPPPVSHAHVLPEVPLTDLDV